jgi:Ni/Co efflux regulator RcnB
MFQRQSRKPLLPSSPVDYPAGTFVHSEKGWYLITAPAKRQHIISKRVLDSWAPQRVVETSEAALAKYRVVARLRFRNGSLLQDMSDGKMYLISENSRRHITSPDVLERIGAVGERWMRVSSDEILLHPEGAPLA